MGGLGNYFIEVDVDVFAGELVTLKTDATASIGFGAMAATASYLYESP